jgi:hypothetical protein
MTLAIARIRFPALLPLLFVNVPCMHHSYRPMREEFEPKPKKPFPRGFFGL